MSTLNYENVGALVGYDYLQGTITALYPEDDTADVSGVCGSFSKVPIFYHCKPTSTARSNGALEGAAGGFAVGDLVVVLKAIGQAASSLNSLDKIELKGSKSTATGPKYYVVGHYDGVKKCSTAGLVFIASRLYYNVPTVFDYFFWWDLATDDYAVYLDPNNGTIIYNKEDYPIDRTSSPITYPIANGMYRFTYIQVPAKTYISGVYSVTSRFVISENIISSKLYDFGAAFVYPGDYVYAPHSHYAYSKIKSVAGCVIKLKDTVFMDWLSSQDIENGIAFTVSSSVPLYAPIETWTPTSEWIVLHGELVWVTYPEPGNWFLNRFDVGDDRLWTTHQNRIAGTTEDVDFGSTRTWGAFYTTVAVNKIVYAANIPAPLSSGYTANYVSTSQRVDLGLVHETITTLSGDVDPLGSVSFTDGPPYYYNAPYYDSGNSVRAGQLAFATDNSSCQFYLYNTGIIHAQSSGKPGLSNTRSSKLESAIADLIQHSRDANTDPVIYTAIDGRYYSETRSATYGSDMLAILNAVRGFPPPLTEDPWCMSSSEEKAAELVATETLGHGSLSYIGMEVLAIEHKATPWGESIAGWMASPSHAEAIMGTTWMVAGWAEDTYPASCEFVTVEPGAYDAINQVYTTEETVVDIPLAMRGNVVCRVVRMTPTP